MGIGTGWRLMDGSIQSVSPYSVLVVRNFGFSRWGEGARLVLLAYTGGIGWWGARPLFRFHFVFATRNVVPA